MSECDSGALFVPVAGRLKLRRNTAPDAWPDLRTVRRLAGLRLNGSVKDSESIPAQSATRVPVNRIKQLTQMSQGPQHAPMGASLSPLPKRGAARRSLQPRQVHPHTTISRNKPQ